MAFEQQDVGSAGVEGTSNVVPLAGVSEGAPDPRLTAFVRLLARQAARDYYERTRRDREPLGP